jgi:hypothetical protein
VGYKSQIIDIFFLINCIYFFVDHFQFLILSCFVFTRSTNMATKLTSEIIILDLIKWLLSRFYIFRGIVIVYPIVCFGNVQDKACSSVISLIKLGIKKTKCCLFGEGIPSIHYSFFFIISFFLFFGLISKELLFILT